MASVPALAQTSKGDKPATQNPIRLYPKIKSKHKGGDRPNTRDISGRRRIRTKNASSASHVFYPAKGPYVNNSAKKPSKPKVYTRTASGKPVVRRVPNNQQRAWTSNLRGGKIGSASASRSFVTRGRKNVYWGKIKRGGKPITKDLTGRPVRMRNFHSSPNAAGNSDTMRYAKWKPLREGSRYNKRRGGYVTASGRNGRAWTGDISGHALRSPRTKSGRGFGFLSGGIRSISGKRRGGLLGGGLRSASGRGKNNKPLPVRAPGIGANGMGKMFGRSLGRRAYAGGAGGFRGSIQREDLLPASSVGGSYSGNVRGRERITTDVSGYRGDVRRRGRITGDVGGYRGDLMREDAAPMLSRGGAGFKGTVKGRRPLKGGGSISGKFFNNSGKPLTVRGPGAGFGAGSYRGTFQREDLAPGLSRGGAGYSGNMKARRPLKGGGSVSGRFYNNGGKPLAARIPGAGSRGIGKFNGNIMKEDLAPSLSIGESRYSGNLKARRPLKGGGSISGKFLANDGKPLTVKLPGRGSWGAGKYQGRLKGSRPLKGGGSVSGKLWNNDEKPLTVKAPVSTDERNYSGSVKLSRFKRYYVKNPHSADEALKKRKPGDPTYQIGGLGIKAKQQSYVRNPNSSALALKKSKPHENVYAIGGLGVKSKKPDYVRNPSSNKKALMTFSPGKAYAKLKDYQGNVKMTKYTNSRMHPDSKFAHGNKDNVKSERSITTNIKLFWAKLFKKQSGQPEIVKEKPHVPRYDRKEKDLWKALYD